jgi:hypothetical protein
MPYLEKNSLSFRTITNLPDKFKDLAIPSALNFKNILSGGSNYKKLNTVNNGDIIGGESFDILLKNVNPNESFSLKTKSKKYKRTKSLRLKTKTSRKKV